MIKNNRLVHTIILSGDEGLGKLTFAKEIAKQIVDKNNSKKLFENYVDINIIDSKTSGTILINNIREIKNRINIAPHESDKKVQIIANCEQMTIAAQNALLKSLEEPSKTTIFILTTSNINSLLETISSRAVIINIEKISDTEAIKFLTKEYNTSNDIALDSNIKMLVKIFGGNIGLIKKILDNPKQNYLGLCENFLFYIVSNNQYEIMKFLSEYKTSNKSELIFFLELFKIYFQKILKLYFQDNLKAYFEKHHLDYLKHLEKYLYIFDLLNQAIIYLSANTNLSLVIAWFNINLFNNT